MSKAEQILSAIAHRRIYGTPDEIAARKQKREMKIRRVKNRISYSWSKFCGFFGFCSKCGSRLNYTHKGRGICPSCRR